MEKIDLNNYEAYFLDYLEGNLSEQDGDALMVFLGNHPDLLVEFNELLSAEGVTEIVLTPDNVFLENKEELKVYEDELSLLTVDFWMTASVEGLLTKVQKKELNQFVKTNQLEKQLAYYEHTILKPTNEQYGDKEELKRKKPVIIPLFYRYASIAAVVLVLIGLFFLPKNENPSFSAEESGSEPNLIFETPDAKDFFITWSASCRRRKK